jgi:hypothetical protein
MEVKSVRRDAQGANVRLRLRNKLLMLSRYRSRKYVVFTKTRYARSHASKQIVGSSQKDPLTQRNGLAQHVERKKRKRQRMLVHDS